MSFLNFSQGQKVSYLAFHKVAPVILNLWQENRCHTEAWCINALPNFSKGRTCLTYLFTRARMPNLTFHKAVDVLPNFSREGRVIFCTLMCNDFVYSWRTLRKRWTSCTMRCSHPCGMTTDILTTPPSTLCNRQQMAASSSCPATPQRKIPRLPPGGARAEKTNRIHGTLPYKGLRIQSGI